MNENKLDGAYLSNLGEFCLNEKDYQVGMDQILSPETAVITAHFSLDQYEKLLQAANPHQHRLLRVI